MFKMLPSMLRRSSHYIKKITKSNGQSISTTGIKLAEQEHPFNRTMRILKNDMKTLKGWFIKEDQADKDKEDQNPYDGTPGKIFPAHCDVCIIGGGAIGSSIAYWLKERGRQGLNVVVVEKDPTYKTASTVLSVGGLRQQFSLPENILMSLYGAEFLRKSKELLGEDVDVSFTPHGYLTLATEAAVDQLKENYELQQELGAKNELLTAKQIQERYPWLNTEGVALGCHGLEKEGWFDPWALLYGFKKKAMELGVHYVKGEAESFEFKHMPDIMAEGVEAGQYQGLDELVVKLPNGERKQIKFAICVIAAGAQSKKVAEMAKVGVGGGMLSIPLPIEPRKRYVYCFECEKDGPGINTPMVIDPSGAYFRREGLGGLYIGGMSPEAKDEPDPSNLDVDYQYFDDKIWPILAHRVPAFEAIKVRGGWAGHYEYNYFDENGIVGPHPYYYNLYIAAGFSGHGIQHSPAIGRAVGEMILDGQFRTIDLTRLGFDRVLLEKPMYETGIV